MSWDILQTVLNLVLGGGMVVTLVTLRSTRRKAGSEAEKAAVETDEKASQVLMTYIVDPLKSEINGLRKDIRRLNRAIDKTKDCSYSDHCPVRHELQDGNADTDKQPRLDNNP